MDENRPFRCGEDMASTWLQDELEIADPFLSAKGIFRCRPGVGRLGRKDIEVQHLLGQPASEKTLRNLEETLQRDLTPSHWAVLARWNGCTLFSRVNGSQGNGGVRIFSAEEIPACHMEGLMVLDELLTVLHSHAEGDAAQTARYMLDTWLPRQLIIGEVIGTGNYLSLDGTVLSGGESPVVLLDAQLLHIDKFDLRFIAPAMTDMLLQMMESPVRFVQSLGGIRYQIGRRTWVPEEFKLV